MRSMMAKRRMRRRTGDDEGGLPEGKTGSKVMTRRQKAIAEGKS